jgi:DNA ligase-1
MLAHKYRDQADKILFPCYGQPKLDGLLCISIIEPSGRATLWTRRRKPINSVPHIVKELSKLASGTTLVLDGELYVGKYKNDFEKIISFVRQTTPAPGHEAIQYHVYDTVADKDFKDRTIIVSDLLKNLNHEIIVPVFTTVLNSKEELEENFSLFLEEGYEGLMARNALGWYDPGRSYNLQKVKEMQDAEYIISGVESGRGSREGQAVLICKTEEGLEFRASPKGKDAFRIRLLQEADKVIGKYATIQYQNLTSLGVPRFGVAKTVRDYE